MSPKGRVKLPPLVLDGDAKVLHRMTLRELHLCLTRALRVAGGDSVEESGRSVFSIMERPMWWPNELPFDAKFTQKLPPEDRSVYYRHLLTACYSYHKQEDTLHLFDSRPGEPPRWRLMQDGDTYTIVSTYTDRQIWSYSTNYQILPLITLAARQTEQYRLSGFEQRKRTKTDERDLVIRTRSQKANLSSSQSSNSSASSSDKAVEIQPEILGAPPSGFQSPTSSPRRFSIMNCLWSPRISATEADEERLADMEPPVAEVRCPSCTTETFLSKTDLLDHLLECRSEKNAVAWRQAQQLYDGLKLVPKQVFTDYEESVKGFQPKKSSRRFKSEFIAFRMPLSSELGRKLFRQQRSDNGNKSFEDLVDGHLGEPLNQNDNEAMESENLNGKGFYPVIYRPPRLVFHYHTYKFNSTQRQLVRRLKRNGGLDRDTRRLLRQCKPFQLVIERLPKELLAEFLSSEDESNSGAESDRSASIGKVICRKRRRHPSTFAEKLRRSARILAVKGGRVIKPVVQRRRQLNAMIATIRRKYLNVGRTVPSGRLLSSPIKPSKASPINSPSSITNKSPSISENRRTIRSRSAAKSKTITNVAVKTSTKPTRLVRSHSSSALAIISPTNRPQREHRPPARYRTLELDDDEKQSRRTKSKITTPSPAKPGRISPLLTQQQKVKGHNRTPKKIVKVVVTEPASVPTSPRHVPITLPPRRKPATERSLEPNSDVASTDSVSGGRFAVPRPLSPEMLERLQQTVDDVVARVCANCDVERDYEMYYDMHSPGSPIEVNSLDDGESSCCSSKSSAMRDMAISSSAGSARSTPIMLDDEMLSYEEMPPSKRLKMSFTEMCATPKQTWRKPSILGRRRPLITSGAPTSTTRLTNNRDAGYCPSPSVTVVVGGNKNVRKRTSKSDYDDINVAEVVPMIKSAAIARHMAMAKIREAAAAETKVTKVAIDTPRKQAVPIEPAPLQNTAVPKVRFPSNYKWLAIPVSAEKNESTIAVPNVPGEQALPWNTSILTHLKCRICGVELSCATTKAWQNFQYHLQVAHKSLPFEAIRPYSSDIVTLIVKPADA